ncbi:Putative transcriptional regulator, TetR [Mycobacteroides abscessus subsp. abscessus]|nr:Putative transcriptional regulator, TetR [Mycobacteroides abscessus subsp. abscessus]
MALAAIFSCGVISLNAPAPRCTTASTPAQTHNQASIASVCPAVTVAFGEPDKDHDRCADVITAIASKWGDDDRRGRM